MTRILQERPCVAKGLRSSPSNYWVNANIVGLLRSPFATQGRSYNERALVLPGKRLFGIPAAAQRGNQLHAGHQL
ncbi:hypothetical protein, partial [Pseudomonas sp.]|uniref:hypothetical protein n=1 Tax=Pseudomonas sp. TaxID=306 RepID=UPI0028A679E0